MNREPETLSSVEHAPIARLSETLSFDVIGGCNEMIKAIDPKFLDQPIIRKVLIGITITRALHMLGNTSKYDSSDVYTSIDSTLESIAINILEGYDLLFKTTEPFLYSQPGLRKAIIGQMIIRTLKRLKDTTLN